MQKLLIIERDTKEELQKAISKNVLNTNMRLIAFSVLNGVREGLYKANVNPVYYEAWVVVAVPDKSDEFYKAVEGNDYTGMTE